MPMQVEKADITVIDEMNLIAANDAIRDAKTVLIVSHLNPDGDAVGSLLGLANALRKMGKVVVAALDDGVPDYLQFLPHADQVVTSFEGSEHHWDVMISTDASDESRTGLVGAFGREHSHLIINLDHHVTNTLFGDIFLVDSNAVSAAEVAFTWLNSLDVVMDADIAMPLLTGLVTDTLGFRTSSVNQRTFEVAQQLMASGISIFPIMHRTLGSMTMPELKLWQKVLPRSVLQGQIIYSIVTPQDVAEAGLDEMTDAGLVSQLIQLNEAHIAVIFKVISDTETQLSLRADLGFDVAEVAFELGGGGHKQAAGATVQGTLDEVMARVLPRLQAALEKGQQKVG